MARQFFKDLPDTTTPLTASRLNGLLDGEEAMGNLVVDSIRSKNMLDKNNVENGYSYSYGTSGSVPTATASDKRATISVSNAIKVKPNTTYTFNSTSTTFRIAIGQMTNEKISLGDTGWITSFPYTITTSSTCNYLGFNFSKTDNSTITTTDFNNFIKSDLILEEGDTATAYYPYQNLTGMKTYSTSEVIIGYWYNGKPIYRNIFIGNIVHDDTLLSNVDTLINGYGSGIVSNRYRFLGFSLYSNNQRYDFAVNKNTSNQVKAEIYSAGATTTATQCNVILEYTKTTD